MSDSIFCIKCGQKLIDGVCPNCSAPAQQSVTSAAPSADQRFKNFFMNPKEKLVCVLGSSYVQNFLSGGLFSKGFSVVSDKRVYFRGKTFSVNGKRITTTQESKTVDLKDVTGTGQKTFTQPTLMIPPFTIGIIAFIIGILSFETSSNRLTTPLGLLIGMLILIISVIIGAILVFCNRITLLTIEFAGGCIAFDVRWFSAQESENFQKQLRIAKDKAIEDAEQASANTMKEVMASIVPQQAVAPVTSNADELKKYAELLKDGLITKEEFESFKSGILSK